MITWSTLLKQNCKFMDKNFFQKFQNILHIFLIWPWDYFFKRPKIQDECLLCYKVTNIDTKQLNKWNNQNSKSRIHKWQDNMDLCENQRWNQVLRKGKHFLLRMWHPSWCRIKEWNVLVTTISWPTYVISHGGHWDKYVNGYWFYS